MLDVLRDRVREGVVPPPIPLTMQEKVAHMTFQGGELAIYIRSRGVSCMWEYKGGGLDVTSHVHGMPSVEMAIDAMYIKLQASGVIR